MKLNNPNQIELQKVNEEKMFKLCQNYNQQQDQNQSQIGRNLIQINIQEIESTYWDVFNNRYLKMKIQTTLTQEKNLVYSKDGLILRINNIKDSIFSCESMENLEQIKYLNWYGQYGQNNQKIGYWMASWKGEVLINVGGYYSQDGLKQGLWKQLINNYWRQAKIYEIGVYHNGTKRGNWKLIYDFQEIGGGSYNKQGQKNGKWIEQSDGFWKKSQVTYSGEYNNGKKVGLWEIFCNQEGKNNYQLKDKFTNSGCGQYAEKQGYNDFGGSIKIGKWIEISDDLWDKSNVFYNGIYKNGQKIGRWDIYAKQSGVCNDFELIGGGSYQEVDSGNSIKIGKWIDLDDGFWDECYVTYHGEYKNGIKVGRWDTIWIWKKRIENIGGGLYKIDDFNNSVKIGKWIEIIANFGQYRQLTYNGEYQNDKKVGRWNIFFKQMGENKNFELIGGGLYVGQGEKGYSVKAGGWIEISDSFWDQSEVTYQGEYNQGIKIGRWDIYFKDIISKKNQLIGGGSYDVKQESCSIKIGKWIELSDGYRWSDQIIQQGEYLMGKKFGRWDLFNKKGGEQKQEFKFIGGGQYEIKKEDAFILGSIKTGRWIELSDEFWNQSEVLFDGEYNNGLKIGRWNINFIDTRTKKISQIGGGEYSTKLGEDCCIISYKTGKWITLVDGFTWNNQITYNGEFKDGKKVGRWNTMDLQRKGNKKMQNIIINNKNNQ